MKDGINVNGEDKLKLFEQAKQMEKESIEDNFNKGWKSGYDRCIFDSKNIQDSDMKEPLFTFDIPTIIKQPKTLNV